jgi:hypothetical protein
VISGTWWVGTGQAFDPGKSGPVPAGSHVIHYGGKVHHDGARDEETATSMPAGKRPEAGQC